MSDPIVETFRDRDAWLQSRRQPDTIGASEAAMALGISPYGTPWALWELKRAPTEGARSSVLQRGHRWESAVVAEYAEESGCAVVTPRELYGADLVVLANARTPWLRETPDAFARDPHDSRLGQIEAKTAMHAHAWTPERGAVIERWDDAYAEIVPAHYAVQGYVQLYATGLPWVDLCALVPAGGWLQVRWIRLLRDETTQEALVEALGNWRARHLLDGGAAPDTDGSDACNRYLARETPLLATRPSRDATAAERVQMQRLAQIRATEKALDAEGRLLRNHLIESSAGARLLTSGPKGPYGQPQRTGGRTTVDMQALRAEAADLVARHERKSADGASFNLYRFDKEN